MVKHTLVPHFISWQKKPVRKTAVTAKKKAATPAVIEEVCRYAGDIIVVNDGSTDDTANILEQYPAIRTITHPVNKGKGTALKHGLSQAQKEGFRYALEFHGFGSDGRYISSGIETGTQHQYPDVSEWYGESQFYPDRDA